MGVDVHERRLYNDQDDPNPARKALLTSAWRRGRIQSARPISAIGAYYKKKAIAKKIRRMWFDAQQK